MKRKAVLFSKVPIKGNSLIFMPTISFRVTSEEHDAIKSIMASDNQACETVSEWLRLLLAREINKRKKTGVPHPSSYQTAHRIGRPKLMSRSLVLNIQNAGS